MAATCWARTRHHASVLALVVLVVLIPSSHAARPRFAAVGSPPASARPSAAAPTCSAGGPYTAPCDGAVLSSATASDIDGDRLTFRWTSNCDGDAVFGELADGTFDDDTLLNAVFRGPAPCVNTCTLRLTVNDGTGRSCVSTTTIIVDDTTPPVIDFGGTLALGPVDTYFPRTQQGGPMLHAHGMVYERPQLTVWWTDYELPENVYEFDATQPPGSTLTAMSQFVVTTTGIEDVTFDPTDQSLWYADASGTVRHVDQTGALLPPVAGFLTAGQYGLAWANGFLWSEDPTIGATQYTLAGAPTGRSIRYVSPPEYGLGYDFDRDLLWTGHWGTGIFHAYDEDTGALVYTSPVIVMPNGDGQGHDVGYGACHLWVGTETLAEDVIYAIPIEGSVCDVSVECDDIPRMAQPTAMDDCDGLVSVVPDESIIPGTCPNEYTIVRTWTATDRCGNDSVRTQRISVFDATPPQVIGPGPASYTCAGDVPPCDPNDVTATDNCPPAAVTCLTDTDNGGAGCVSDPLVLTRTWQATDTCGLVATWSQTITVVDPAGPTLSSRTPPGACGMRLFAISGAGDVAIASPAVDVLAPCAVTVVNDRTSGGADATDSYPCGTTVVTFDAQDACGLTATCRIAVVVAPAFAPPSVGSALRVRKNGAGSHVLDWSLAGPAAGPQFCVLRSENDPQNLVRTPLACGFLGTSWTEPMPTAKLICYDVRSIDCSAALSGD